MILANWPCPLATGGNAQEYALVFDRQRPRRLLIVPALFDEGNRMRRLTVETMRRLDVIGIDSFLPDLPGCNESLRRLQDQTPTAWLEATAAAARHFGATHVLGIRGGCLFTPPSLPCWHYAPAKAAAILRQMLRARMLASREAGREENREDLAAMARSTGIELAGYALGADFYREFEVMLPAALEQGTRNPNRDPLRTSGGEADFPRDAPATPITQDMLGGSGLWLRAEPDEDRDQADALAAILARGIAP
ncbi:hypothetical protein SAMN05518801_11364 [Novosphingobium sp. CF614]|uniref:hypothetical protein n=1 Tax=Novosphingobium sp. CF614 TaxID=1884364 RepID=UPI0008E86CB2|nr:hypothetical protein [Novosphingobium sp. CF614]SFG27861.1 hypothetical protein SAMN05518801_11364 [Novosphingobium sp. CF614]